MEQKVKTSQDGAAFAQAFANLLAEYGFTNGYFVASNTTPDKPGGVLFYNRTKMLSPTLCGYFEATQQAIEVQCPIVFSDRPNN